MKNTIQHIDKTDLEHKRMIWATGFKELISLAIFNISLLAKVSGGAIVGLITIFGHAWVTKISLPADIFCTLAYFVVALGVSILCGFFAYLFQAIEMETNKKCLALCIRIFSCVLALVSYCFLAYGSYVAVNVFSNINSNIILKPLK